VPAPQAVAAKRRASAEAEAPDAVSTGRPDA
jgi:hypothetical protein